jgi:hypothetical protein
MSIATLPSLRVLPVEQESGCWRLFGYFPGTRDAYRLIRCFVADDPNTPPTDEQIDSAVRSKSLVTYGNPSSLRDCTELALAYGSYWNDMVDQFRAARGKTRRRRAA